MRVLENQQFPLPGAADQEYLRSLLGGLFESHHRGWVIKRVVGHFLLPSGEVLQVASPKATAASVVAWAAYCDPSLSALRLMGPVPELTDSGDISALLARLFTAEVLRAASSAGLARIYERRRVATATVRGAIDFNRLARRGGNLSKLPCTVWERTLETPLNRFLRAATACIERNRHMRSACIGQLSQLLAFLGGVRAHVTPALLAGSEPLPRHQRAFEPACALARLILRSYHLAEGTESAGLGFFVNLEALFETSVALAFREAGISAAPKAPVPYVLHYADGSTRSRSMAMDVFLPDLPHGPVVVDAKYKTKVSSANLQQMVTYCMVTGARRAVLVFPGGQIEPDHSFVFEGALRQWNTRVELAELDTSATDVDGWRTNARRMVDGIVAEQR